MTTSTPILDAAAVAASHHSVAAARFEELRARVRRAVWIEAMAVVAAALAIYAVVTFGIDRTLRLEVPFRVVLLALFVFYVVRIVRRRLVSPLSLRLDDDEMAFAVERRDPGLRQAFISSLQFDRALLRGDRVVESPAMMAAVVADVQGRMAQLPFSAVVDQARVRKFGALLFSVFAAFVAWGAIDFGTLKLWAMRNLGLSAVEWPRYTRLAFVGQEGGVLRLPQGDPLTVRIGVQGPVPDQVFLYYEFARGERGVEPMSRTGDGEFTLTMDAVLENAWLHAEGGDGLSEPLQIEIVERPRLEDVELQIVYPEYMQKEPEAVPPTEGELRLLRGSELRVAGRSQKTVREAFALLGDVKHPFAVSEDRHSFRGALHPTTGSLLVLDVIDEDQLGAGAPPRFLLRIVDDKPPTVDLRLRGISSTISFKARLPGDLKVKDDFGITFVGAGIRIVEERKPGDPEPAFAGEDVYEPVEVFYGDPLRPGEPRLETTATVDLQRLNLVDDENSTENRVRPGMLVSLRYLARDNYGPGDPHETKGEVLTFRVIPMEKLIEELRRRQVEQRQELERIRDDERAALLELRETLNPNSADERAKQARARFKTLSRLQTSLGRRVAFVGESYQRILWEYENNRVMESPKVREIEAATAVPLAGLARDPFPATAKLVEAFAASGDEATREAAVTGYTQILERIDAILKVMEQAETLAALLERLRGVIKVEDRAIQDVEKRLQEAAEQILGPGKGK